jgi:hypothetical protein
MKVHTSTYQCVPVCTGVYWYILVCTSMYQYVLVSTGTCRYVLVCVGMYQSILAGHSIYQYVPVQTFTCQYVAVCTSMYHYILVHTIGTYILVHTIISSNFQHSYSLISRYSIHRGTRQYNEVPKSLVPLKKTVQGSTKPCTLMYLLVPPYSGVQDFWVLHCTALYRDVSSNGKSRNSCVGN